MTDITMPQEKYILIGKIGAVYGLNGWVKVQTYTEYGNNILEYTPWYVSAPDQPVREMTIEDGKSHGNGYVVKFAEYNTPETARAMTGKLIHIKRSQLPELKNDEYYWSDLVGLTVKNLKGEVMGKVIYLIETGSNDVLVVKDTHEITIPYLPGQVVKSVDLAKQEMIVDWEPI